MGEARRRGRGGSEVGARREARRSAGVGRGRGPGGRSAHGIGRGYHRVAPKGLSAEPYLAGDSPLGWALAVRMKRGRLRRVEVMLRSLARILRASLSDNA